MKKVLILAVVLMMLPLNAMALEMLTDQNMDQITGQALNVDGGMVFS